MKPPRSDESFTKQHNMSALWRFISKYRHFDQQLVTYHTDWFIHTIQAVTDRSKIASCLKYERYFIVYLTMNTNWEIMLNAHNNCTITSIISHTSLAASIFSGVSDLQAGGQNFRFPIDFAGHRYSSVITLWEPWCKQLNVSHLRICWSLWPMHL